MSTSASFLTDNLLFLGPWQAMERAIARLMQHGNFENVQLVGRTGDGGADILATYQGKRWIVQVKFRRGGYINNSCIDEVLKAMTLYHADIPILATNVEVSTDLLKRQRFLGSNNIYLQIWDRKKILKDSDKLPFVSTKIKTPRPYQEKPINNITRSYLSKEYRSGIVVMATGLGKTVVIAESIRKLLEKNALDKVLVLAHTNELVYQLEKSFWPFLRKDQPTAIWNGNEKGDLENSVVTFACIDSAVSNLERDQDVLSSYDLIVIDEAHHSGSPSYQKLISFLGAGTSKGPYLLGMTATPWRADERSMESIFSERLCAIDLIEGMKKGYLANVDYRMHTDNVDWDAIGKAKNFSIKALNRTIFIQEWDDAVLKVIKEATTEVIEPKVLVFCSTIEHAMFMRNKINAFQIGRAGAIYSGSFHGKSMSPIERSSTLCDFSDGRLNVMCAVDIFNEGMDVPDVNIIVFQRVTHSRRIFVQQLGRGLRIKEGKNKVIVLDFVSDVRRFAAGLEMQEDLDRSRRFIKIGNPIKFVNASGKDAKAESFLKKWIEDAAKVSDAGENDIVLKFPPELEEIK